MTKQTKTENNPKINFPLSPGIKRAQDYLRDSLKQLNTFGSRPSYTLIKPSQIVSHSLNSPGHEMTKKDGSSSPLKTNEWWVHVNLLPDSRLIYLFFLFPKGPISSFCSSVIQWDKSIQWNMAPGYPDRAQSEDLLQVRPQFTDRADINCTRELDEKGLLACPVCLQL